MPFKLKEIATTEDALREIARLIHEGSQAPRIRKAALTIISDCESRDDLCELEALYNAVKNGDDRVRGLENGFKYVADPRWTDWYQSADQSLQLCRDGACGSDCDDHTILIGSLAASLGFMVGARAWGKKPGDYTHVYAVAAVPKSGDWPKNYYGHGLDTTVPSAYVGWEPKGGYILTMWPKD